MDDISMDTDTELSNDTGKLQNPLVFNKYLPYNSAIEREAEELLKDIKVNLSRAVQMQELWPGALFWTNRLRNYIRLYGLYFSKEDHIKFIHLLYQLVTIPHLESLLIHTWSHLLVTLLKKPKTLSPKDIILPWRPLYKLVESLKNKFCDLGMKIYSIHTVHGVKQLVDHARRYFSLESTQEMLDEWRPFLCPFDEAMMDGMDHLADFLPTLLHPKYHHRGFKLWFEELLNLWLGLHYSTAADVFFIKLFVRLAKENVGYIDWSPYLPRIFSRILRSFNLPVGPNELQTAQAKPALEAWQSATFIVSVLGGKSDGQDHLRTLMLSLESFYHPSNFGRQTRKLLTFLKELSSKFIIRLRKERFKKPRWFNYTPDHVKLSEDDIDKFVECLLPSLKMAIFSKFGTMDAALALHKLALIRPERILPDLLDSTYTALETLTEPHQVIATLQCLTAVSRSLLSGGNGRYPEGKKHLFSLLTHAIPGIDSNDFRKTLVSALLISSLVTMVPLVDCTSAIGNEKLKLTEDEEELCSLTSHFENFVLLYLDRCFALIENTRMENAAALDRQVTSGGKDYQEVIMGAGISDSVHTILVQSSPSLFKVALEKLYRFATSQIFETEVAGRMCADMCASASKAHPEDTLKLFVPHCVTEIDKILEDPYQFEAEHPDHALIWNIQLLSHILRHVGSAILPYADDLLTCLKKCVHLKSKPSSQHAASALSNILQSLTTMYSLDTQSIPGGYATPPEEHLYTRDWSISADKDNLGIDWHVPSLEELSLVDRILAEFLEPELDTLRAFMGGEELEREKLNQVMVLIKAILMGAAVYLSMWKGTQLEGCPTSVVSMTREDCVTFAPAKSPLEQYTRDKLALFIHQLAEYIMKTREDDTKTMFSLVQIIKILLTYCGANKTELENRWRGFKYTKAVVGDELHGKKSHIRPFVITRVQLQHELRLTERSMSTQTELHHLLFKDLLSMAVSEYAQVRLKAQNTLSDMLEIYLYSGRMLLPHIIPYLKNPYLKNDKLISHKQFKGALHVLLIAPVINVFIHNWEMMKETLPVIVKAGHSEKPSIQALMTKLSTEIQNKYEYFTLEFKVPESTIDPAASLHISLPPSEMEEGRRSSKELVETSIKHYKAVVKILVDLIEDGQLQWRYSQMATHFLLMLIRHDHPLPTEAVRLLTLNLVHDALNIRKMAITAVACILQQQKRKTKKVPVDLSKEVGVLSPDLPPGEKAENAWLCYDPARCPATEEEWEEFKFVDKTHWGYYTYPKELLTYAPYKDQPRLNRSRDELSDSEKIIFDAFSSADFVEKFVSFLSLEEIKGQDRYDIKKFLLFKYLFRNFGTTFLHLFRPHIEKLGLDAQHASLESNQRFAAEIISAIISGSKNWSYSMLQEMRSFIEPLMNKVKDAITPDTIADWSNCMMEISANRDPRRIHWLIELFMVNPLNGENGSFKDASRLFLLQSLLAQQEWRVSPFLNQLVGYLKTHLTHSYKNVRVRIGSVLSQIHIFDLPGVATVKFNPKKADLIQELFQKMPTLEQLPSLTEDEDTLKLCKTCLIWLQTSLEYDPDTFRLIAKLLPLVIVEKDDEFKGLVKNLCASISHAELSVEALSSALSTLQKATDSGMWKVKILSLQMLQILIFKNLFLCIPYLETVTDLLVSLCESPQMEVRELAASSISGLIRCGYINAIGKLKAHFIKQSHCKLPRKLEATAGSQENGYEGALMKRHSGVLGLSALVGACPYSVPEWLPDILDEMVVHLHDPAPIQGTVKKTMSEFKRTHHDSWSEHKQKFTDDQLVALADLLVSPSYYA